MFLINDSNFPTIGNLVFGHVHIAQGPHFRVVWWHRPWHFCVNVGQKAQGWAHLKVARS